MTGAEPGQNSVRDALFLSDIHLGWSICHRHHARLLEHLPGVAGDAELIVLNGDIIDRHRRPRQSPTHELVQRLEALVEDWRREGREVVYVEGNHDPVDGASGRLRPDRWHHDFQLRSGERVRVLHGHRFSPAVFLHGAYEALGRHVLALENRLYQAASMRAVYPFGPGWLVGAWGLVEDRLWRPKFPARATPLLEGIDVLVHGHFHFGPGQGRIGRVSTFKSGSWVSRGHLGTVDRLLRLKDGIFQRMELSGGRWRVSDDGR